MKRFKPILAGKIDTEDQLRTLTYPLIVMPKFDGIRCIVKDGRVMSRTLKDIPNRYICERLQPLAKFNCIWDGELVLKSTKDYNKVQSAVMSQDGEPIDFEYVVFDRVIGGDIEEYYTYTEYRFRHAEARTINAIPHHFGCLNARCCVGYEAKSFEEVLVYEEQQISMGYEGIVLRSLSGPYKFGRSTLKEQYLLKFKRTEDAEAEILECLELMHNDNTPELDERGYTKRSSHGENKYHSGMLGSFRVRGINGRYKGKVFDVSCGSMTHDERRTYWSDYITSGVLGLTDNPNYLFPIITYKYAKHRGTNDAPAEPVFKSFRKDI